MLATIAASGIGPLTEQEEFLPKEHELMVLLKDVGERFPSASNLKDSIVVNLNWGIKGLDRDDVGSWDAAELGKIEWDDTFTVAPA